MPPFPRHLVAFAALELCLAGPAFGQTSAIAQQGSGVSSRPPVELGTADAELL